MAHPDNELVERLNDAWTVVMAMAAGGFLSHTVGWHANGPPWLLVLMFVLTATGAYRRIRKARATLTKQGGGQ